MPPRKKNIVVTPVVETVVEPVVETVVEPDVETVVEPVVETVLEPVVEPVVEPLPLKKQRVKREKKGTKHKVVAIVTPNGIEGTFQNDVKRPLIAHLPIHSSEIQFHDQPLQYDPNPPCQPEPFNAESLDPFSTEAMFDTAPERVNDESVNTLQYQSSTKKIEEEKHVPPTTVQRKEYGPTTLLVQYKDTHTTKDLPSQTDLACFWCCEHFSGRPCVIPIGISDSVWNVYGNYCTPQCAMAYLLSEILDTHTRWERISLLNRLYAKQINGRIYPAPNRECLKRFGGPIPPEEFRSICENQSIRVDIHMPPMVSILASMDTKPIDFYETPLRNTFTTPHQYAVQKPTTEEHTNLKLRRNKPLKDKESTLDACLQFTIR